MSASETTPALWFDCRGEPWYCDPDRHANACGCDKCRSIRAVTSALVAERDALKVHAENMGANWKSAEGEADRQRERANFAVLERDRLRALLDAQGDAADIVAQVRELMHQGPVPFARAVEIVAAYGAAREEAGRTAAFEAA